MNHHLYGVLTAIGIKGVQGVGEGSPSVDPIAPDELIDDAD
jgi:hypothetical protein